MICQRCKKETNNVPFHTCLKLLPIKVLDYNPLPIDTYKGNWGLYDCIVEFTDGSEKEGSIQGDTHNWAFETFEEN